MAWLLHWLFRRRGSHAAAALPPAPAVAAPAPDVPAIAQPEPGEPAVAAGKPAADGEISPARLDAALQRLRDEHPPAPEG